MKRNLMVIILALCLVFSAHVGAEGLLPSLTDMIGKPMPSLGEAIGRYPDEEIPGADGSNTEVFQGVSETDFNTFSIYLSEQGATLADYQVVGSSFSASIQVDGMTIVFVYDTQTLEAKVTYSEGTYDKWLRNAKTQSESTGQLPDGGKTDDGMPVPFAIPNHSGNKPADDRLAVSTEFATEREEKLAPYRNAGGYVTFGYYEQDKNTDNGKEPIEWLVLDYDAANNRVFLISRYGLDAKPYNTEYTDITWEKCTLRTWLNEEFIDSAFSTAEQEDILITEVDNSRSQGSDEWDTDGGNNTQDKIFLLSYAEANEYLGVTWNDSSNMKSRISPTAYALQAGAWISDSYQTADSGSTAWWWLRSPGDSQNYATYVDYDGSLYIRDINFDGGCVRPALWINLESDTF